MLNNTSGNDNTADGDSVLSSNTTGSLNTSTGRESLYSNITGVGNTASGNGALYSNTSGSTNTAMGYGALYANTTGTNNTGVGLGANVNAGNYTNSSAFGNSALATASNQVRIGDNDVTSIGGYANWTNISDGRVKKNIKQNVPGLAFINKLQPVTYNLDLNAADRIVGRSSSLENNDERIAKETIMYTGFIAQDVELAAKSLSYDFSGVDAAKNSKDLYGLRYSDFVVPLVKAVQELSSKNDSKDSIIALQQGQINDLNTRLSNIESVINVQHSTTIVSSAALEQNAPNPFAASTIIGYTLPQTYTTAQIIIRDNSGHTLKAITISGNGKGTINLDAATLSGGAYIYSLLVDGRLIDTKQMLLAK